MTIPTAGARLVDCEAGRGCQRPEPNHLRAPPARRGGSRTVHFHSLGGGNVMARCLLACGVVLVLVLPGRGGAGRDSDLWLEEVTGEKALAWVKERNAESTRELTKSKEFAALNERLLKIMDSDQR